MYFKTVYQQARQFRKVNYDSNIRFYSLSVTSDIYILIHLLHSYMDVLQIRYVVCLNLLERRPPIVDYMFEVNDKINELKNKNNNNNNNNSEVYHIVRDDQMDKHFLDYIKKSNNE